MKYYGQLAYHTEQGCGGWIQFHDDRGLHGDKKQYWDWDWTINFNKNTKLENIVILGPDGKKVYDGLWTGKRGLPICCEEISRDELVPWLQGKYKAIITTDEVLKGYTKWINTEAEKILLGEESIIDV